MSLLKEENGIVIPPFHLLPYLFIYTIILTLLIL